MLYREMDTVWRKQSLASSAALRNCRRDSIRSRLYDLVLLELVDRTWIGIYDNGFSQPDYSGQRASGRHQATAHITGTVMCATGAVVGWREGHGSECQQL